MDDSEVPPPSVRITMAQKHPPPTAACLQLNPALFPLVGVPAKNRLRRSCKASTQISMMSRTRRLLCEDEDTSFMRRWNSAAGLGLEFSPLRFFSLFCWRPHVTVGWYSSHILPLGGLDHSCYRWVVWFILPLGSVAQLNFGWCRSLMLPLDDVVHLTVGWCRSHILPLSGVAHLTAGCRRSHLLPFSGVAYLTVGWRRSHILPLSGGAYLTVECCRSRMRDVSGTLPSAALPWFGRRDIRHGLSFDAAHTKSPFGGSTIRTAGC